MRSIFATILVWTLGTLALALGAFWAIAHTTDRARFGPRDFFSTTIAMNEEGAALAYEEGGRERLAAYLARLNRYYPGTHTLTDPRGIDLVSGVDRSKYLRNDRSRHGGPPGPPHEEGGLLVFVGHPRNGQYRFVTLVRPEFHGEQIWPYYAVILAVIALLASALAVHLAAPLRRLRGVVDRFGRGDLAVRARSSRRDEIGQLSAAFDRMAERIETLLAAERQLLQDVSHELRSPLARLRFSVELARSAEDREAALDRVKRDVGRLADLVDELLQLTRAEGDPAAKAVEMVSLEHWIADVVDDCRIEAGAKSCGIAVATDGQPSILGDGDLLRRALENVLRNAVRHAPERTTVEVALRAVDGRAVLSVRDHGEGVPDEVLGSIFEPFFRVESDRSRSSGGVGLGLAIARRAIALHHGSIVARNASPGLCVEITLPLDGVA